jgi:hypothetical protein
VRPSITLDERGVILHVTDERGEGVAVPITSETAQQAVQSVQRLITPEGKRRIAAGLWRLFIELTRGD